MVNNYVPNSDLAFIVGDGGISRASPSPTKVSGEKVNACLELQSTTRADIFLKPKTDIQIAAIPNPTSGMIAFSSDSDSIVVRGSSSWDPIVPPTLPSILYTSVTITHQQLVDYAATPLPIPVLPAPGAGFFYVVHGWNVVTSAAGSNINLNGGSGLLIYSLLPGFYEAALLDAPVFEEQSGIPSSDYTTGLMFDGISESNIPVNAMENSPLAFGVNSLFTITGGSTEYKFRIWYSIVPSGF